MNMNRRHHFIVGILILALVTLAGSAAAQGKGEGQGQGQGQGHGKGKAKANHHNGKQMLGEKIKANGRHLIHKKGPYTASADVKDGKIAGFHVQHDTKGEVAVKKYKTNKKMAQAAWYQNASYAPAQDQYLGTMWIGYAYVDEYGDEEIYWFPYDMILDGDTGAVEYVPAY